MWVDSYLAAAGLPHRPGMTLRRRPEVCLRAIAAIAEPEDLDELMALWPLIRSRQEQYRLVDTFEIVTVRRFEPAPPPGSRVREGGWLTEAGAQAVDYFVRSACATLEGDGLARRHVAKLAGVSDAALDGPGPWLKILRLPVATLWAVPLERLTAFGAPAVSFDRTNPGGSHNAGAAQHVRRMFGVTN